MNKSVLRTLTYIAAVTLLSAVFSVLANAQAISGDLTGTVVDTSGAVVNGATVDVVNVATGQKVTTTTKTSGEYRFTNLPIGRYNITVTAQNFSPATLQGVPVELNKINTANVQLRVGEVSTSVEVSGAAPQIDTTTAQVQTTYAERQAQDLPSATVGAGVLNLSLLNAGVSSANSMSAGTGPSVGGQRPRNNNFTVEGVDNNSKTVTGPLVTVPNDAVANFTVLQNQYSPEFGHSSGGQFNTVVQSGTNTFHGSAYEYFRNRNLNALDQQFALQGITSVPRFDNNRFGGTLGGPVIKNKLFFFTNAEYNPLGQASSAGSPVQAPTADGLATIAGLPGISATNLGVFKQFVPVAGAQDNTCGAAGNQACTINVGGQAIPVGTVPIVNPNFLNTFILVQSVDYNISDKDQLRARYIFNRLNGPDTAAQLSTFFTNLPVRNHLINLSEYHSFGSNLNNEVRAGFNRLTQTFTSGSFNFPGLDAFPNIQISDLGGGLQIGPDPNAPQFTIQNSYQLVDNLSWTKGAHNLKFGIEGRKYISPQSFTQRARGDYNYRTLDRFLRDISPDILAERSVGNLTYYGDQAAIYWYANDQWRLNPHLTVNLGIRYEYTTIPQGEKSQALNAIASAPEVMTPTGPLVFAAPRAPRNNWAPRVGIAWSPGSSGNTSIRAGFGMSYDVLYDNIGITSLPPELSSTINVDPKAGLPNFLGSGGIPNNNQVGLLTFPDAASARAATSNFITVDQKNPYSIQWNLGIQHSFKKAYTFEARYLGTRGVHLNVQDRINRQPITTATNNIPLFLGNVPSQAQLDALPTLDQVSSNGSSFLPQYTAAGFTRSVTEFAPLGWSTYHGLALQFNRRFENGLQFQVGYTWSHNIDNSTADFFSTVLTPRRPQDFQNFVAERGTSALDRRHRLTFAILYDMPFFKNSNWIAKNLLGNWELAPIYTYESPEFATVQNQADANLNGDAAGDRAFFNASGTPGTGSDIEVVCNSSIAAGDCSFANPDLPATAIVGYRALDPTAQFIRLDQGAVSNLGRNTLKTRPINNVDLSLVKRISLSERYRFEFQAQAFNLFNHPQFLPFAVDDVTPSLSSVTTGLGATNMLTPGSSNFNRPDLTFSSNPRTMQLVVKFIF